MTPRALATVLLAVLGVYLLGHSIAQVGTMLFFLTLDSPQEFLRESHADQALITGAYIVLEVGFALCVLLFRARIAAALFPVGSEVSSSVQTRDVQAALFGVVGLYFAIKALATLAQGVAQLSPPDGLLTLWPHYASSVVEAVFGVALFFGARGVSGAWFLARSAGHTR